MPRIQGWKCWEQIFWVLLDPPWAASFISPAKRVPQPLSPFNLSWHPLPPPRQGEENSLLLYQKGQKGRVM